MSKVSRARTDVLRVMRSADGPLGPAEVAAVLGKPRQTMKVLLWKMARSGQLASRYTGEYTLPGQDTTVPAVPASGIPSLWDDLPAFEGCY